MPIVLGFLGLGLLAFILGSPKASASAATSHGLDANLSSSQLTAGLFLLGSPTASAQDCLTGASNAQNQGFPLLSQALLARAAVIAQNNPQH